MPSARELLQQELQRRSAQSQVDDNAIREDISAKQAMAEIDPEYRRSLRPQAAFIDELTGSNLAQHVKDPTTTEQAINQAHAAQRGTPKQNLLGYLQAQMGNENADAKLRAAGLKGKELTANNIMKLQEGENIPLMLEDITGTIARNKDIFGPVEGRFRQNNPWDTRGKTVDAEMRAASQAFGRYMEGGVLKHEDEVKYRKMFPNVADTPGVAEGKLNVVKRLMAQRQSGSLGSLSRAGYDTTMFASNGQGPSPTQPRVQKTQSNFSDPNAWTTEELEAEIRKSKQGL